MSIDAVWEQRYATGYGTNCPSEDVAIVLSGKTPGKLLDVGCGTGSNALYAHSLGWKVYGIDGSKTAIEKCQARFPGDMKENFSIANLPVMFGLPNAYDMVLDIECLYCLPFHEAEYCYREILRVLRPGGMLFMKAFKAGSWKGKEVVKSARFSEEIDIINLLEGFNSIRPYTLSRQWPGGTVTEWCVVAEK